MAYGRRYRFPLKQGRILLQKINSEIERLRAVAVLLTLTQHWGNVFAVQRPWAASIEQYGFWIGVDIFFVISGFVITASLAEGAFQVNRLEAVKSFFIKRSFRLFPLAWCWVVIIVITSYVFQRADLLGDRSSNLRAMAGIFLHGANLLAYCVHAGYGCFKEMPANSFGIYWSLSLEEQFYIFYAFLFFISRGSIRILIGVALVLIAVQLPWARPFPSLGWFIRLDALACGCLLYFFRDSIVTALKGCPVWIARLGSLSAILVVTLNAIVISQWPAGISLIAFLSAIPVLLAVPQKDLSLSCGAYFNKALQYLGSRSYSIYLSHMPTMRFIQCIGEPGSGSFASDLLYMGMVATCILVFSELGYRFIEMPMRGKGRQIVAKRKHLQGVNPNQSDLHRMATK